MFPKKREDRMEEFSGKKMGEKLAIIVPGFIEDTDGRHKSFRLLSEELEKRGISSVRIGLGYSPPEIYNKPLGSLKKEAERVSEIRKKFSGLFQKIFLVGVSMGGLVSQIEVSKNPGNYAGAVFWYSPTRVRKGSLPNPKISGKEKKELSDRGFLALFKKNTEETFLLGGEYVSEIRKLDSKGFAKKITCPSIIIHPKKDSIVPFSEGKRLFSSLGGEDRTLVPLKGDHGWWNVGRTRPDREAQAKAIKLTCEWISAH